MKPRIRLLLADDQELIRSALGIMLELEDDSRGRRLEVGRGDEVVAAAKSTSARMLALLDIEMPGIDGPAVMRGSSPRRCRAAGRSSSPPSGGPVTCAGRWSPARPGSSSRMHRRNSWQTRSVVSPRASASRRSDAGRHDLGGWSIAAHRQGTRRPRGRQGRGDRSRDRRQAVPVRGHSPQLPVRRDRQDRDAQPGRGSPDRGRARVALTALVAATPHRLPGSNHLSGR